MKENNAASERDSEWRRLYYRRLMLVGLMLTALAAGALLNRWISRDVVDGPVGEYYQKTIDTDATSK